MRAIIVAAGMGSRLWPITRQMPKTLLPFGDSTILGSILTNLGSIGISQVHLVVGFRSELIEAYLVQSGLSKAVDISVIHNPQWKRGNGLSVLAAREFVAGDETALLSMSDHLVHPRALRLLYGSDRTENLLLTDSGIQHIRDIEDATKVVVKDNIIRGIGKTLTRYNAVDCGVFRINRRFMDALETAIAQGEESISAAARMLVQNDDFASVPIPPDTHWMDIDTPDDYDYAQEQPARYLSGVVSDPEPGAGAS